MAAFDSLPLWAMGIGLVAILSIAIEIGYQVGKRIGGSKGLAKHPIESSVTTAILSLMAFMMGFIFTAAAAQSVKRRNLALEEANIASTLYLRADFLPEAQAGQTRALIREFLEIRLNAVRTGDLSLISKALARSNEITSELWDMANAARSEGETPILALFVSSLNDLIDNDANRRTTVLTHRLPPTIWIALGFLCLLSVTMLGMSSGIHGRRSRLRGVDP